MGNSRSSRSSEDSGKASREELIETLPGVPERLSETLPDEVWVNHPDLEAAVPTLVTRYEFETLYGSKGWRIVDKPVNIPRTVTVEDDPGVKRRAELKEAMRDSVMFDPGETRRRELVEARNRDDAANVMFDPGETRRREMREARKAAIEAQKAAAKGRKTAGGKPVKKPKT